MVEKTKEGQRNKPNNRSTRPLLALTKEDIAGLFGDRHRVITRKISNRDCSLYCGGATHYAATEKSGS